MNRGIRPKRRTVTRFYRSGACAWIALICLLAVPGTALSDAPPSEPPGILETARAGRHNGYTSVVFQFGSKIQYEKPVLGEEEIVVRLKNVTTTLSPSRRYKATGSWVKLEKEGTDLTARIGLPAKFVRMKDYFLENPYRLVIDLYVAGKSEPTAPEAAVHEVPEAKRASTAEAPKVSPAVAEADPISPPIKETAHKKPIETTETVSPQPVVEKAIMKNPFSDNGLLTLNLYEVDIREALSALAMQREINVATSKDVSGEISVHLYNVTLDEALNAVTLAAGCKYQKHQGLYYVFRPKETEDPEAEKTHMRIFQLKYAEVAKIQEILDALPDMRMVKLHEPSKTIIVEDTWENIERIESIVKYWDTKPKQVVIEAKILEITLTDDMSLGVDWERILRDVRIGAGGFTRAVTPTTDSISPVPDQGSGVFANVLTAAGSRHQFTVALDALQSKTKVDALSTPKVLAIHGKPAKVQVGGEQGYRVTTVSEGIATETIEFIDTGIVLDITPYIDEEKNILLKVQPSITSAVLEEGIPVTSTALVTTWLLAKNGETAFIGGLIQDSKTRTSEAIPCLGSIPVLGKLFGRTFRGVDKTELVVLITPRVVDAEVQQESREAAEKVKANEERFKKEPLPPREQLRDFFLPDDEKSLFHGLGNQAD